MLTEIVAKLFTDPNAVPIELPEPDTVPNVIPDDQHRKVSERLDATDQVIREGQAIRNDTRTTGVQFAKAFREMATGIVGGDLLADRTGRTEDRKG